MNAILILFGILFISIALLVIGFFLSNKWKLVTSECYNWTASYANNTLKYNWYVRLYRNSFTGQYKIEHGCKSNDKEQTLKYDNALYVAKGLAGYKVIVGNNVHQ